jgi:hypothetical protein
MVAGLHGTSFRNFEAKTRRRLKRPHSPWVPQKKGA